MVKEAGKLTKKQATERSLNQALYDSCSRGISQIKDNPILTLTYYLMDKLIERKALGQDCEGYWYSQICRSISSIAANYAEGTAKCSNQEVLRFLKISRGSAYESYVWAEFTYDKDFCNKTHDLCDEIDHQILAYLDAMPIPDTCTVLMELIEE